MARRGVRARVTPFGLRVSVGGAPRFRAFPRNRGVPRRSGGRPAPLPQPMVQGTARPMVPMVHGVGIDACIAAVDAIEERVDAVAQQFVLDASHMIEEQAKLDASTGVHPPGQNHLPGTGPGPNVVSGNLRRSISVEGPTPTIEGWLASTGPAIIYGRSIELGMYRPPGTHATKFARLGRPGGFFVGSPPERAIRARHPGFGGRYPYLEPARDSVERSLPAVWLGDLERALEG